MPKSSPQKNVSFRRRFDVLGLELSLATNDAFVDERFSTLYGAFLTSPLANGPARQAFRISRGSDPEQPHWEVFDGGERVRRHKSVRRALEEVEAEICRRVLELLADCVSLHAGTVLTPGGAALIVGPSGAGKSTLTVALATQGWKVGGDDAALLDPGANLVRPIPRCFHLDACSLGLLQEIGAPLHLQPPEKLFLTPSDFGLGVTQPLKIETIIVLAENNGTGASWSRISQAETAACLAAESGGGGHSKCDTVRILACLVGGARCYRMERGDLRETLHRAGQLLCLPDGGTLC